MTKQIIFWEMRLIILYMCCSIFRSTRIHCSVKVTADTTSWPQMEQSRYEGSEQPTVLQLDKHVFHKCKLLRCVLETHLICKFSQHLSKCPMTWCSAGCYIFFYLSNDLIKLYDDNNASSLIMMTGNVTGNISQVYACSVTGSYFKNVSHHVMTRKSRTLLM